MLSLLQENIRKLDIQVTREQNLIDKCLGSETVTKEGKAT